jgi:hypothetical protein
LTQINALNCGLAASAPAGRARALAASAKRLRGTGLLDVEIPERNTMRKSETTLRTQPQAITRGRGAEQPIARVHKPPIIRPEELTADERDALAVKIEAARCRGRPPSI